MELPKETLAALREALPYGASKQIAEKANYSEGYVSQVLNGVVKITDDNMVIIQEAQRIIREGKEKSIQLNEEIKKTLSE